MSLTGLERDNRAQALELLKDWERNGAITLPKKCMKELEVLLTDVLPEKNGISSGRRAEPKTMLDRAR